MSNATTELRYHRRSRLLELCFRDGERALVPAAWLRGNGRAPTAASEVGLARIEPLAADCVRLHFDDGHRGPPCSFQALRELALSHRHNEAVHGPAHPA